MHAKSQALDIFHKFRLLAENKLGHQIKTIQSNNAREFMHFDNFLASVGISHCYICAYAHQQNGNVERKHRHIVEIGLSVLADAALPLKYWNYAFQTIVFIIKLLIAFYTNMNQIITCSVCLAAPDILCLDHTIKTNLISSHMPIYFWDILPIRKGSSVFTLMENYIFLGMFCLMIPYKHSSKIFESSLSSTTLMPPSTYPSLLLLPTPYSHTQNAYHQNTYSHTQNAHHQNTYAMSHASQPTNHENSHITDTSTPPNNIESHINTVVPPTDTSTPPNITDSPINTIVPPVVSSTDNIATHKPSHEDTFKFWNI